MAKESFAQETGVPDPYGITFYRLPYHRLPQRRIDKICTGKHSITAEPLPHYGANNCTASEKSCTGGGPALLHT